LAVQIGHCVLHNSDGVKSIMVAGRGAATQGQNEALEETVDSQDIIHAWRDFECSFFAGALLCPKVPFRQLLDRYNYEVNIGRMVDVSTSVIMRRMTAVSPYSHWHYFDAYPPGKLKAVYRGNGIPLPWGNMRMVQDPCQHWAVFRMIDTPTNESSSQISILDTNGQPRIYACESIKVNDLAGNPHVLCAGIDLNPAIESQGSDADAIAGELKVACANAGGTVSIPKSVKSELSRVAKILNIAWVERGIETEARLICPRSSACPRTPCCSSKTPVTGAKMSLAQIKEDIVNKQ